MAGTRRGDFTHKQYIYKVYDNGFNHKRRHYLVGGEYLDWTLTISAPLAGNQYISGGGGGDPYSVSIGGISDSSLGLDHQATLTSDPARPGYITSSEFKFDHSYYENNDGIVDSYYITVFDYRVLFDIAGGAVEVLHESTTLGSDTLSSDYDYIRMYESGGTFYIDNSDDGVNWVNFASRVIDYDADRLEGGIEAWVYLQGGGPGDCGVAFSNIEWLRHDYGFKGIIDKVTDDLEFTTHINTLASTTTVKINQSPLDLPEYIKPGAFIDIYVNYWSYLAFGQEDTILDHNDLPILDHNDQPITGFFTSDLTPEKDSWIRFSGYIASRDLDYDAETVTLSLVSHGEELSNIVAIPAMKTNISVINQDLQNAVESVTNRRQTFTLEREQKISNITARVDAGAGGTFYFRIGTGATTISNSNRFSWSGSLPATIVNLELPNDVILPAGTYWVQVIELAGGVRWYYQNTGNAYEQGSRQQFTGGSWVDIANTDAYFELLLYGPDVTLNYTSEALPDIINDVFDQHSGLPLKGVLARHYSQVTMGVVDDVGYNLSFGIKMNTTKSLLEFIHGQLLLGWWWSIDPGTNEYTLRAPTSTPDHVFYAGKDMLKAVIKEDITGIVNDVWFVGATINEAQDTLTIRTTDTNSIANYRRGLNIISDGRVSRYDTAQAFSDFSIASDNGKRITTQITIQAKTYDIETIRVGHSCRLVNMGGQSIDLIIASVNYSPYSVTLSLSNVPSSLLRSIDATTKSLESLLTQDASNAI